jgi:threonine dehydratase
MSGLPGARNVTEFNYRIQRRSQAHVFVGHHDHGKGSSPARSPATFAASGVRDGQPHPRRTGQEHMRHMVGGRTRPLAQDERSSGFVFPERPGALIKPS